MFLRNLELSAFPLLDRPPGEPADQEYMDLQLGSHCVTGLYLRLIGDYRTEDTAKVVVEIRKETNVVGVPTMKQLLNVLIIDDGFDMDGYLAVDITGRKAAILEFVSRSLVWAAMRRGWPTGPLLAAKEKACELGLINEFYWKKKKAWSSPDRRHKARIFVRHDFAEVAIDSVFFDRSDREIGRCPLVHQGSAAGFNIWASLGSCRWTSSRKFRLTARSKILSLGAQSYYECELPTG